MKSGEYTTVRLDSWRRCDSTSHRPWILGIRGTVVRPVEGANAPVAVSGATVVVEEIRFPHPEPAVMSSDRLLINIINPDSVGSERRTRAASSR